MVGSCSQLVIHEEQNHPTLRLDWSLLSIMYIGDFYGSDCGVRRLVSYLFSSLIRLGVYDVVFLCKAEKARGTTIPKTAEEDTEQ